MIYVTTTELKKLADASRLKIPEQSIPQLQENIEDVLRYASRVASMISEKKDEPMRYVCNVTREDVAIPWNYTSLLAYAAHSDNDYFIVPAIL